VGGGTDGGVGLEPQPLGQSGGADGAHRVPEVPREAEVAHVTKARQLAVLVRDISKVLVDLGMPPILGIPHDPRRASVILEVVGTILDCLWEAYVSCAGP
jgi:hypothetical protein